MSEEFHYFDEPNLIFGANQRAKDPHDGLALFGAVDARPGLPSHVVIGTVRGVQLWGEWSAALNQPAACEDRKRQRPWPPYPGFDVAFGERWPGPVKTYLLDSDKLHFDACRADRHERTYEVANHFISQIESLNKLDEKPALAICVVPDEVYQNCRSQQFVAEPSDERRTATERKALKAVLADRDAGQSQMFDSPSGLQADDPTLEKYGLSPDFRRQLKARMMEHEIPVQIVQESTLAITDDIRRGLPGANPLSDRLWNFSTGVFYKLGRKPWRLDSPRDGVCYIGLAYKRADNGRTACCAAQLFLDSGDGMVFVGDFGPWYSEQSREFHLTRSAAQKLLKGALATYQQQDGRPLKEIFIHARSGLDEQEFSGFQEACPDGVDLCGIRVRKDRLGPRVFRHGEHKIGARRGMYPVLRGVFWQRSANEGLLFTSGFKERIAAYDGWEVPVPLGITLQHGDGDLLVIAQDILGLTKANYNACQLGESEPITVKYSDRVGEILLSNRELRPEDWQHNLKYYI